MNDSTNESKMKEITDFNYRLAFLNNRFERSRILYSHFSHDDVWTWYKTIWDKKVEQLSGVKNE